MSEIKVNSVVNSTGDNDSGLDLSTNDQVIIKTANTTAVTVDSSQNTKIASNLDVGTIRATNGTSAMTINSSGIVIPKGVILQVTASDTDQSFDPSSGFGKVEWESVEIDTISGWSTSNHRYTPSVAGYYLCGGSVRVLTSGAFQTCSFEIRKSDSGTGSSPSAIRTQFQFSSDIITNSELPLPTGILQMNGSTDYIEVFVDSDETIVLHDNADRRSHFFAMLVHAT